MSTFSPNESAQWFASLPKLALSANAVLRDPHGRVALVRNTYRDGWSLPGGVVDDNEPPAVACVRELAEELGFVAERLGPLLAVQWAQRSDGSPVQFLSLTFDAGVCQAPHTLRAQPEEIAEIGFFEPGDLPRGTRPFIARRLAAIRSAPGTVVYLEETWPPDGATPL
ncbi:NUDIX hydrolase [Actinocrinis puniceicyclus]|uniref:NUDIX hydrolase n=1 Tax=Actinocrinis puniceicyclus TaxID=977794 RepID=A0A8J8BCD3_9ACTN|nr:NUDIX hydrolase [Actinocrinis puniceicyclus]MBS2961659.1 NUDIX hydrolase [Actinocrinis puniceicyclus]